MKNSIIYSFYGILLCCACNSLVPRRSGGGGGGGGERAPGTHRLRMRLISQISGKLVYFSNLPCYIDVIIN